PDSAISGPSLPPGNPARGGHICRASSAPHDVRRRESNDASARHQAQTTRGGHTDTYSYITADADSSRTTLDISVVKAGRLCGHNLAQYAGCKCAGRQTESQLQNISIQPLPVEVGSLQSERSPRRRHARGDQAIDQIQVRIEDILFKLCSCPGNHRSTTTFAC